MAAALVCVCVCVCVCACVLGAVACLAAAPVCVWVRGCAACILGVWIRHRRSLGPDVSRCTACVALPVAGIRARREHIGFLFHFIDAVFCCALFCSAEMLFRVSTGRPPNSALSFSSCSLFIFPFIISPSSFCSWCEVYNSWLIFPLNDEYLPHTHTQSWLSGPWLLGVQILLQ